MLRPSDTRNTCGSQHCTERHVAMQCLEAQFYTCATTGAPLSAELTGNGPEPIGKSKPYLPVPGRSLWLMCQFALDSED